MIPSSNTCLSFGTIFRYPILQKSKPHKNFKHKLESFIECFVASGRSDVFQDGYLLPTVLSWLTSLCTSAVRAFRHTCTFMSLKIGEELIAAYKAVDDNLNKVEKQLEAEARSGGNLCIFILCFDIFNFF